MRPSKQPTVTTLRIKEHVGPIAVAFEDGERVFELIVKELEGARKVELDFEGVEVFASLFFNGAIGQLFKKYKPASLNNKVSFRNVAPNGASVLKRVIENAKRFHGDARAERAHVAATERAASDAE